MFHVQHCINCEKHSATTRHIPGSYDTIYHDLKYQLAFHLPPFIMTANHAESFQANSKTSAVIVHPPIGCFELSYRPFLNAESFMLHSKLKSKCFPVASDIISQ